MQLLLSGYYYSVSGRLMFRVDGISYVFLDVYGNLLLAVSPE